MYNEYKKGRCVISHIPYALKGQKLLAQGSALGFRIKYNKVALKGQKHSISELFVLSGRIG